MIWTPCKGCTRMVYANHPDPTCNECKATLLGAAKPSPRPRPTKGAVAGGQSGPIPALAPTHTDGLIHSRPQPRPLPPPDRPRSPYGTRRYRDTGVGPRTTVSGGLPSLGKRYS